MGNTLNLPSPTKLARLGHFPPVIQAGRLAGLVFYVYVFSLVHISNQNYFAEYETRRNGPLFRRNSACFAKQKTYGIPGRMKGEGASIFFQKTSGRIHLAEQYI
jgi:hypothetical protein